MLSLIRCEAAKRSFGGRRSQTGVWEREKFPFIYYAAAGVAVFDLE